MRKVERTPYNPYSIGECLEYASSGELALTYVNEDGETVTFSPDEITKDVLLRFRDRVILAATGTELTDYQKWMLLKNNLGHFWSRRGVQYGRLMDAVLKTYDPISNYDRHEAGGWTDTNILGARSGSDSGSDVYGAKSRTVTETPGVTDTITETPGVTTTRTETPATTETVTETPGVTTTNTRTDNLSESVTETPRVATTTTSTPGVAMTTSTDRAGDNSATYRAVERVTVSPDGVHSDVTVVEPTSGTNQTATNNTGTQTNQETRTGTNQTATVMSGLNTSVESFEGNNQSVHARTGSNTTGTSENAYTDTHSKTTTQASATDTNTRLFNEYHVFGNIGVTTSAQMLTGEIELRGALDLITHALVEFVDLVSVYF